MGVIPIYRDSAVDSTAISNIFIDEYLKDANDAQIKIYLYLVRMMSAGLPTSIGEMADQFNHTEKDVVRALRYWETKGLLVLYSNAAGDITGIRLCPLKRRSASCEESRVISIEPLLGPAGSCASEEGQVYENKADSSSCEAQEIQEEPAAAAFPGTSCTPRKAAGSKGGPGPAPKAAESTQAPEIRKESCQLLLIVEQYIGKPLSASEIRTIYYISDELHFSDDLIDFLVEYCVGLGKKDFRYIEKVALNWAEQGISTTAAAKQQTASPPRTARRRSAGKKASKNTFNQIEQNPYDFEALEQKLLKQ